MATKKKSGALVYQCSSCNYTQPRWLGRCPECGEWNTFIETITEQTVVSPAFGLMGSSASAVKPMPLSKINPIEGGRFSTGIGELDRVLGGGAMKRSAVLVGGEPGIGKSTLLLQAASLIQTDGRVLYVSGEESASQIKSRADRLGIAPHKIEILCSTRLQDIESALNSLNPVCVIIDSIQTVYTPDAGVVPGTVNQLKYCTHELVSWEIGRAHV